MNLNSFDMTFVGVAYYFCEWDVSQQAAFHALLIWPCLATLWELLLVRLFDSWWIQVVIMVQSIKRYGHRKINNAQKVIYSAGTWWWSYFLRFNMEKWSSSHWPALPLCCVQMWVFYCFPPLLICFCSNQSSLPFDHQIITFQAYPSQYELTSTVMSISSFKTWSLHTSCVNTLLNSLIAHSRCVLLSPDRWPKSISWIIEPCGNQNENLEGMSSSRSSISVGHSSIHFNFINKHKRMIMCICLICFL